MKRSSSYLPKTSGQTKVINVVSHMSSPYFGLYQSLGLNCGVTQHSICNGPNIFMAHILLDVSIKRV